MKNEEKGYETIKRPTEIKMTTTIENPYQKAVDKVRENQWIGRVLIANLKCDPIYQREVNMNRVEKMAKEFKPLHVGSIKCSERKDGIYVYDGNHRVNLYRILDIKDILCEVNKGMTREDEADAFIIHNTSSIRPLKWNILKAGLSAGSPIAKSICMAVKSAGLSLGPTTKTNQIGCCGTIWDIFKKYGHASLSHGLFIIKKSWNGIPDSLNHKMIYGMVIFADKIIDVVLWTEIIEKLRQCNINEIKDDAEALTRALKKGPYFPYAYAILQHYNHGKKKNRIPNEILLT